MVFYIPRYKTNALFIALSCAALPYLTVYIVTVAIIFHVLFKTLLVYFTYCHHKDHAK